MTGAPMQQSAAKAAPNAPALSAHRKLQRRGADVSVEGDGSIMAALVKARDGTDEDKRLTRYSVLRLDATRQQSSRPGPAI